MLSSVHMGDALGGRRTLDETALAARLVADRDGIEFVLVTGFGIQLYENGEARIGAGHFVGYITGYDLTIMQWFLTIEDDIPLGSSIEEQTVQRLLQHANTTLPDALNAFQAHVTGL